MFKRAAKRQKRSDLEEKLGLAEDLRGAVSDTDESGSDSDEDISESEDSEGSENEEQEEGEDKDDESESDGEEAEEDGESEEELEDITINNALKNPLFSEYPHKRCAVCPGRLFTANKFGDEHLKSKAHNRRIEKFTKFLEDNKIDKEEDVHAFIDAYNDQQGSTPKQRTKKEEKRVRQLRVAKEKRMQRKIQAHKTLPVPLDEVEKKHVENEVEVVGTEEEKAAKETKKAARRERKKTNKAKYAEERRRLAANVKDGKKGDSKTDKESKKDKKDTNASSKPKKRKSKSKE